MATLHTAALLVTLAGDEDAVAGGGVLVAGGRVAAVGEAARLAHAHPDAERVDHGDAWLIPGLRNAHGHVAGWPPDAPLEVFLLARYGAEDAERTYARTLATAADLIRSGVVWTHHLHYGGHDDAALRAYRDAGLRVQFCPGALDRFAIVPYDDDDRALLAALPPDLAAEVRRRRPGKPTEPVERYLERWRALRDAWARRRRRRGRPRPRQPAVVHRPLPARAARGRGATAPALPGDRGPARVRGPRRRGVPGRPARPCSASSPPTSRSRTSPMPPTRTSPSCRGRGAPGVEPVVEPAPRQRGHARARPRRRRRSVRAGGGRRRAGRRRRPARGGAPRRRAPAGGRHGPAPPLTDRDLLAAAAGRIAPGEPADLVALDPLAGATRSRRSSAARGGRTSGRCTAPGALLLRTARCGGSPSRRPTPPAAAPAEVSALAARLAPYVRAATAGAPRMDAAARAPA